MLSNGRGGMGGSQTPGNEPREQAGPGDWGRSLTGRRREKSHCLLYLVLTGLTAPAIMSSVYIQVWASNELSVNKSQNHLRRRDRGLLPEHETNHVVSCQGFLGDFFGAILSWQIISNYLMSLSAFCESNFLSGFVISVDWWCWGNKIGFHF